MTKSEILNKLKNTPIVTFDNLSEYDANELALYLGKLNVISFIIIKEDDEIYLGDWENDAYNIYRPLLLMNNGKSKIEFVKLLKDIINKIKGKVLDEAVSRLENILEKFTNISDYNYNSLYNLLKL